MKSKYLKPRALALYAMALIALGMAAYPALATISVTPILVVIEGRQRYADVNLINTSAKQESYAMNWKFMKMIEGTGLYETVKGPTTPFDLSQNLVMTPRRVTIEPNSMQKVRLGLRLKGEPPPPGDYRAHLELRQDTPPKPNNEALKEEEFSVAVNVNVGFSVPIVYRVGESDATVSIGDVKVEYDPKAKRLEAHVQTTRSGGPFGVYGHLIVYHNDKLIGEIKNANIFPEINNRLYKIPLNQPTVSGGTLRVVYKHYDEKDKTVFAEKSVPVAN